MALHDRNPFLRLDTCPFAAGGGLAAPDPVPGPRPLLRLPARSS